MQRPSIRKFRRYSFRTLIVAATVLAAWLATWANRARQQTAAVEAIESSGGEVKYEWDYEPNQGRKPEFPFRYWAGERFGHDLFRRVNYVLFSGIDVEDADLQPLEQAEVGFFDWN